MLYFANAVRTICIVIPMLVNVNSARAWQDSRVNTKCDMPVNYVNMVSTAEDNLDQYSETVSDITGDSSEAERYASMAARYAACSSRILEKDAYSKKAYEYAVLAEKYSEKANEIVTEIARVEEEERVAEEEARKAAEEEARKAAEEEEARRAAAEEEARKAAEEEAREAALAEENTQDEEPAAQPETDNTEPETDPQTEPESETEIETETETESDDGGWDGSVLTAYKGVNYGPSGKETYYNLDMTPVITLMRNLGYSEADYPYWIRDDGCKMFGPYIICAANLDERPRGSLVQSSLGLCMVCDTGGFAAVDRYWIDIATNW